MATASLGTLEAVRLPDLLVLIKQTAESTRSRRMLDPCAEILNDEVVPARALYTRARAWLLGASPRRAEPRWRRLGDMEAAFFALYDTLRSQIESPLFVKAKSPTLLATTSDFR